MEELVSINGNILSPNDAKVSVMDRGFLYGDSVYEVIKSYNGTLFTLDEHVARLFKSAKRIYLTLRQNPEELKNQIRKVFEQSGIKNAYIRVIVTRGVSTITLDPFIQSEPTTIILVKEIPQISAETYTKGLKILISKVKRNPKGGMDPNIKSGNYLNNILAIGEAKSKGFDDAVMLNEKGFVTEATTSNIFIVKNNVLLTPPDDEDILHGITRSIILKICSKSKIKVQKKHLKPSDLLRCDECFLTGSVKEITPVSKINGYKIPNGIPGKITQLLQSKYKDFVVSQINN